MNKSFLDAAEQILANDPDIVVPVKKLWKLSLESVHNRNPLTLGEFSDALASDDRFEFVSGEWIDETGNNTSIRSVEDQEQMESLGIFAGERVKLQRVDITPALLAGIMIKKMDTTINALIRAWDMRPEGDSETEDQLLHILVQAKKLQHDLHSLLAEESFREKETQKGE